MNEELYIPEGAVSLDKLERIPQIRLGIQGPPGYGKTWAALTFPNPIVLNFDRGLGAHTGNPAIIEVPFYNPAYVDSIHKRDGLMLPPNRKDALIDWIAKHGVKLKPNQTLILDSNTQIERGFHIQYALNPKVAKHSGEIDSFDEWKQKLNYYGLLCDMLKQIPCNVVFIAHETPDRDKTGNLNGQIRPLVTGQFADQLASHFTDYFRALCFSKTKEPDRIDKALKHFQVDKKTFDEWCASTPPECGSFYLWETISNSVVPNLKTSTLVGAPRFVLANYSSFEKYRRKV